MASIDVRKLELFEILKNHKFVMCNDAVLDSAKLIEKSMSVSLIHPISEYLSYEIRNKLLSLKNSWQKNKTANQELTFINEISRQTCKFQIRNVDIEQNNLMVKFETNKEMNEKLASRNQQLETAVKELSNQLLAMQQQVNQQTNQQPNIIYMTSQQPNNRIISSMPVNIAPIQTPAPQIIQQQMNTVTINRADIANQMNKSGNTIKKILLKSYFDKMDVDSAPTPASMPIQTVVTQSNMIRSIAPSTNAPVLEPFRTNPTLNRPINITCPSGSTKISSMILPEKTSEKTIQLDLTKATTEFIIEQKQQIMSLAKQKEKIEKCLARANSSKFSAISKCSKRKNFFTVSNRQQRRLRTQIKESISESTSFLKNMGLCLSAVEMNPIEFETNDFKIKVNPSGTDTSTYSDTNGPTVNNILYVKDKWAISDRAYAAFRNKCHLNVPTLFQIKKRRADIDQVFRIKNNEMGVFMTIRDKLKFCLEKFFERKYGPDDVNDPSKFKDSIIHIKMGADGTNIGRNLKLLNFTFTIINEGIKAKSATGNYTLGIFEIENENYVAVQTCFKELIDEMEQLKQLKVGKNTLQLVYYLGGDWKMLAHVLGIQSANSKYPCIWCKCNKEEFYNLEKEWSITDPNKGCRTHEEHAAILNHEDKKKIVSYGYQKSPIFKDIIPISRYMIDMLHLFLRISDTLFNLLVKDCSLADNFDMGAISKFDVSIYKHMNSLQHFLNEKCNVRFTFLWVAETKKLTWRDLVGPEKHKLFQNFNLAEIIPDHENFKNVEILWTEFYQLMTLVKECSIESEDLKKRTGDWLKVFLKVYNKTTVTPYMHAFVQHLHEFVHLYKDINAFNCQGLEKLNDLTTGQYFKGTNKHESALHQILKKRNRIEYLTSFVEEEKEEQ